MQIEICAANRSGFGFLQFFGQGRHDFENVGDYTVVGDFGDGGVGVFIDGNNGARAFHADNMWDGPADSEREIQFWRDSLPGAANLTFHGKPTFVADRARGSDFTTERFGDGFGLRNIFRSLDAAADGHDEWRLAEIDGGFCFPEEFQWPGADLIGPQFHFDVDDGTGAALHTPKLARAKGSGLERDEPWAVAGECDVRDRFSLKHLADEN